MQTVQVPVLTEDIHTLDPVAQALQSLWLKVRLYAALAEANFKIQHLSDWIQEE